MNVLQRQLGVLGRGYGSAAFNPLSLSPLLWLDYTQGVETTTGVPATVGQTIQRWLDQSGNARHATQAASGQRGTLTADGIMLSSSSTGGYGVSLTLPRPYTIFVVEKPNAASGAGLRTINSSTINALISASRGTANNAFVNGTVSNYKTGDTNTHVLELAVASGVTTEYLVDGVSRAVGSPASADWGGFGLGSSGVVPEPGGTTIKEILVLAGVSTSQRTQLRTYLASKHSVTL